MTRPMLIPPEAGRVYTLGESLASVNKESRTGRQVEVARGGAALAAEPRDKAIAYMRTPAGVVAFKYGSDALKQRVSFQSAITPLGFGILFISYSRSFAALAAPLRATICRPFGTRKV